MRVKRVERIFAESTLGAVVGAVTGAIAGPPGVVAGAVIGWLIGLLAGVVGEQEDRRAALKERRLDAELGITAAHVPATWVRHFTPMPRGRW
ncbi:MAG TPA: hypothetical protein VGH28_25790 [Polyangiaceae bacterium]